jgi:hypothetical protein
MGDVIPSFLGSDADLVARARAGRLAAFILALALKAAISASPVHAEALPESLRIQQQTERSIRRSAPAMLRALPPRRARLKQRRGSARTGNTAVKPPLSNELPPNSVDYNDVAERLKAGYPDFVIGRDGSEIVFKDGSRLSLDDGHAKTFQQWLENPDIKDMFRFPYPRGAPAIPPPRNLDPGRVHNAALFTKIYGDCRKADFEKSLTRIAWLPKKTKQTVLITSINGVADHLKAVSAELELLPSSFDVFLFPSAGGFNCRRVAGTDKLSPHGYGIAVDLGLRRAHYWLWDSGGSDASLSYRNDTPEEIITIFEKHGFIWGGRWFHYDTMHFEYRPELVPPQN